MTSLGMDKGLGTTMLESIHEGMDVYDVEGNKIGTVDYVQFGDENPATPEVESATATDPNQIGEDSLMEDIAEALMPGSDLPEEVRSTLIREGYIKIDSGFLRSDRYAPLSQVASVNTERVTLKTNRDELISR
ncbi:MAG TPA: hypothetical protein PKD09_05260 [Aggregatilinea sp.]|uniref:hypothetical protein n=1 Tax=Aggregatilinea sp. TaxID=2806333 RepID=UPI002C2DF5A6|nr:hypothetical protein [Aggregatilinea sp.]HML21034.1 hypothetical protein [Aggregatilinea sp.]